MARIIERIFGGIVSNDAVDDAQVTNNSTYIVIDQFNDDTDANKGLTLDNANGDITILTDGDYHVRFSGTATGTAGELFDIAVHVDGVVTNIIGYLTIGTETEGNAFEIAGYLTLAAGEVLDVRVKSTVGAGTFKANPAVFEVEWVDIATQA